MTQTEDHLYIDRILQGDHEAYAFLVNKYQRMAYTVALKIMRNVEDAEDTAQESFIKAFQKIHSFKKDSKFSTWLYTIVYRTAVYNLRKNRISTEQIDEDITQNRSIDNENPFEKELNQEAQIIHIKKAIDSLPKLDSLLVTLFYINENSITEIQEITGLSVSNIKVKLYRARKKIKKQLITIVASK
ncbi:MULTISPECIES: RNA polymerase sigma factor [Aquimarina]|uniref:Sigma-70 family RNA polymerase sigma factor n=1 Tax=Aquimarina algiphila TaxID=2047982 RepID=A0A554VCV9_9FLAO|nr:MULTISPECIES: sigma-70 family RNA polymerase sigma factor [Aquimarina]TSE04582.1 sigma-70 family RNA polymerase sigma factor [Aquimarina algiphila]